MALKVPEDSREMMSLIEYINEAKSKLVVDLNKNVEVRIVNLFFIFYLCYRTP